MLNILIVFVMFMIAYAAVGGTASSFELPGLEDHGPAELIVQIGGRFCEYHRVNVQEALRRFPQLQRVEFLNQRGTVLVRYWPGTIAPEQFAASIEQALATAWKCTARIDRHG